MVLTWKIGIKQHSHFFSCDTNRLWAGLEEIHLRGKGIDRAGGTQGDWLCLI
jgi:hypothetical protein